MKTRMNHRPRTGGAQSAFTIVELVVVLAGLAVLASIAVASSLATNSQILISQCANNQRRLAASVNIYANQHNDFMPVCKFRDATPWYTYEVARVFAGTDFSEGFENLGLLVRSGALEEARPIYCPAQKIPAWTYDYYDTGTSGWPTGAPGDDNIRAGYSYFPQVRAREGISGVTLPKVTLTSYSLEFGSLVGTAFLSKLPDLDPDRSFASDLVHSLPAVPHSTPNEFLGVNAVFPDGAVAFQDAPEYFNPNLWNTIGSSGLKFRRVMSLWEK